MNMAHNAPYSAIFEVACAKRGGNVAEASEGAFRSAQSEATAKPSFQRIRKKNNVQ
jgi:hypothetical protein